MFFIFKFDNKCRKNIRDGIVLLYIGFNNFFFRISVLIIFMVFFVIFIIYKLVW